MAWLRDAASRVRASLTVTAGVGAAVAGLACWAGPAAGETGPPSSTGAVANSPYGSVSFALTNVEGAEASACGVATNSTTSSGVSPARPAGKPTKLTVGVGATQSVPAGARFAIRLAVTVTDAEGTPVPDALVSFAAPNRGPSGSFTIRSGGAHRHRRVQVKTNACGVALAPAFTANHRAGGYVVVASVEHVKAAFALVNEGR